MPRNNTASSWSRRQDELEVQIQQNRRRSQEFEDKSQRSEESLRKMEKDIKQRREEKMMSDDLARVKVEQSQRRDENRALGLRERLEHLSGGGGELPAATLTKTTSCPAPSFQPQSLQSSQQHHQYQPINPHEQKRGTQQSQPQPQSLQRRDDPRALPLI